MKKTLSLALSLIMIITSLAVMPFTAQAIPDSGDYGDCHFTYSGNSLTVTGTGDGVFDVSTESEKIFKGSSVRFVIIKEGVKKIGANAFEGCTNLDTLNMKDAADLTEIGKEAFKGCTSLVSGKLTFPTNSKLNELGEFAFEGCTNLGYAYLPDSVKIIDGAFRGCTSLNDVKLGSYVTTIRQGAFAGTALTSLYVPSSVTIITEKAIGYNYSSGSYSKKDGFVIQGFADTDAEKYANNNGITFKDLTRGSKGDIRYYYDYKPTSRALGIYSSKKDAVLDDMPDEFNIFKDEIRRIEFKTSSSEGCVGTIDYTFSSMKNLSGVTFEEGVKAIGASAFTSCPNLTSIKFEGGTVTSIGDYAFANCNSLESLNFNITLAHIGESAFGNCTGLKRVYWTALRSGENPERTIANYAFSGCTSLEFFSFADGLTSIGSYAFYRTKLDYAQLPGTVISIGYAAFSDCSEMTSFICDESDGGAALAIPDDLCLNCPKLVYAALPKRTSSIGAHAFGYNYDGVEYTKNEKLCLSGLGDCKAKEYADANGFEYEDLYHYTYEDVSYNFDKSTGTLTITGKGIVDDTGFRTYGSEIKKIIIGEGLTEIDSDVFEELDNLEAIQLPSTMKIIGEDAFNKCKKLTSINLPEGLTTIDDDVFIGCSFKSVTLPNSLTTLGAYAFTNCDNLTSISIPRGIKEIGESAFMYCTNLTSVSLPEGLTTVGAAAFAVCPNLKSVTIPDSVTRIDNAAFGVTVDGKTPVAVEGFALNASCNSKAVADYIKDTNDSYKITINWNKLHSASYNVSTTAATTTATGLNTYTCKYCGAFIKSEVIPKLKRANTMTAKGKKITLKASKLRKKAQTFKAAKVVTVKNAKGKVTYSLVSVKKGKKNFKKYFKVAKNGKLTVKKKLKKGTYKIKIKVTAAGNNEFNPVTKTVTVTVRVK
ncbi:MAG: leucine-rich repeat domain-containing protein [Eubacterium sp.]|nr:leucine-rich repeat domain-containing protein [Eubacterium sp.]